MAGGACITCYSSISLSAELISAFKEGIIFFLEGKQPNKQTCEHLRMSPRGQCISFETSLQKMKACISHTRWTISWFRIHLEKLFLSIYPNENRESWNPPRIHGLEVPNLENTSVGITPPVRSGPRTEETTTQLPPSPRPLPLPQGSGLQRQVLMSLRCPTVCGGARMGRSS